MDQGFVCTNEYNEGAEPKREAFNLLTHLCSLDVITWFRSELKYEVPVCGWNISLGSVWGEELHILGGVEPTSTHQRESAEVVWASVQSFEDIQVTEGRDPDTDSI